MPMIDSSSYRPPLFLRNGHVHTIYANLCRKVNGVQYKRVRVDTPDEDFLDLDYAAAGSARVAIIAHGLEGCSQRPNILGLVRALRLSGWDAVAWNFRGCSGEPNRSLRFYHSGDTGDLDTVVQHVMNYNGYRRICLVGFSLGGNIVLKYLGEQGKRIGSIISAAVAFSVPCDLRAGALKMAGFSNRLYMRHFLLKLRSKIQAKKALFPGKIDDVGFSDIRTFRDFDNRYTAPIHGFKDAEDYWAKSSSKSFLPEISVPTLLVNAMDDPFLSPRCYPCLEARTSSRFFLETPRYGGHVGFVDCNAEQRYWSEFRAIEFLESFASGS